MCLRGTGDEGTEGQCQLRVKKFHQRLINLQYPQQKLVHLQFVEFFFLN